VDSATIEAAGVDPLCPWLAQIAAISFNAVIGNNLLFDYVVTFDPTAKEIRLSR
jgi:hypothetical protein